MCYVIDRLLCAFSDPIIIRDVIENKLQMWTIGVWKKWRERLYVINGDEKRCLDIFVDRSKFGLEAGNSTWVRVFICKKLLNVVI